jgi:hypothetical protein
MLPFKTDTYANGPWSLFNKSPLVLTSSDEQCTVSISTVNSRKSHTTAAKLSYVPS